MENSFTSTKVEKENVEEFMHAIRFSYTMLCHRATTFVSIVPLSGFHFQSKLKVIFVTSQTQTRHDAC
jgi:hypothetical protein